MAKLIKEEIIHLGNREVRIKVFSKTITIEVVGEENQRWASIKNMDEEIRLYTSCYQSTDQWLC